MKRRQRGIMLGTISSVFAVVLIVLLFHTQTISAGALAQTLVSISPLALVAFLLARTLLNLIAAFRWQFILQAMGTHTITYSFCFMTISLSVAAACVLPQQLAFLLVRALIVRFSGHTSLTGGGFSVIYDIAYNCYCCALLLPASLLWLTGHPDWALPMLFLCLMVGTLAPALMASRTVGTVLRGYDRLRRASILTERLPAMPRDAQKSELFSGRYIAAMIALACSQNLLMVFSCYSVATGIQIGTGIRAVLAAYPLVYFSGVFGLTPGNVGVMEWTWTGTLAAMGVPAQQAASFALSLRLIGVGSHVLFAFGGVVVYVLLNKSARKQGGAA